LAARDSGSFIASARAGGGRAWTSCATWQCLKVGCAAADPRASPSRLRRCTAWAQRLCTSTVLLPGSSRCAHPRYGPQHSTCH
jgi:hypothetical protein